MVLAVITTTYANGNIHDKYFREKTRRSASKHRVSFVFVSPVFFRIRREIPTLWTRFVVYLLLAATVTIVFNTRQIPRIPSVTFPRNTVMKKNCNTSCDGFSPGPEAISHERREKTRKFAQSQKGKIRFSREG